MAMTQKSMEALVDMFRASHNVPSTPAYAKTRDVKERTIWAYWAQGESQMPDFFQLCVQTWRHHNPNWDIRILDNATLQDYLSEADLPNRFKHMLSIQTASDCVRLALLARYGGVWMDVNILLRRPIDDICWRAIEKNEVLAAAFFHPTYGTQDLGGEDFVESWFLASKRGNPFFLRWRDEFRELLHNRLDTAGLVSHPLYERLDLSGFDRLNDEMETPFDFREYLAIHVMCHRLLEIDEGLRKQWREQWQKIDAAATAFRIQELACEEDLQLALIWLGGDARSLDGRGQEWDDEVRDSPLIKFRTPDYAAMIQFGEEVLLDQRGFLGRQFRANGAMAR